MSPVHACPSDDDGFTLVELLVVLCIILILTAITVPSLGPMMASYNLNRSAGMVTDELTFARQAALTKNADVEVRIDQLGTQSSPTDLQFRAVHSVLSATGVPLDKVSHLPDQIIISPNVAFSTLLDYTNASRSGLTMNQETLAGSSSPTTYVSFLFRATGGTGLSPVTPPIGIWDLALLVEKAPVVAATGLPSNYVTIQIEPVDGQVRTYRP
jgi:uncharacterized protein (TIGR02596 family)